VGNRDTSRLIVELAARASRVSPLWPPGRRVAAWLVACLIVLGLVNARAARPDLAERLRESAYLIDLASILILATLLAHRASLAAVPGREQGRLAGVVGVACGTLVVALGVLHRTDAGQSLETFMTVGLPCLGTTALMAIVPTAALLVAVRRGAPVAPARAAALAGAAGWLLAYLAARLTCPLDEVFHIWVWHLGPVAVASACAAALGAVWLERWKRSPPG
jgi:hypothetical protein